MKYLKLTDEEQKEAHEAINDARVLILDYFVFFSYFCNVNSIYESRLAKEYLNNNPRRKFYKLRYDVDSGEHTT